MKASSLLGRGMVHRGGGTGRVSMAALTRMRTWRCRCRAPEIYEEQPYSYKSDVWALGCVMYEMMTGKPAFMADNLSRVVLKVGQRGLPREAAGEEA